MLKYIVAIYGLSGTIYDLREAATTFPSLHCPLCLVRDTEAKVTLEKMVPLALY